MTATAVVLTVIAAGLLAFGWWGVYTAAGQRRFDEMAGMIPMFALWAGVLLLAVSAALGWMSSRRGQ